MVLVPHPVQRGDVAEPDQRLRVGLEGRDVDAVEQAGAAAPTSQGHDRPDVGVADRLVEIGEPVLVSSREVAEPVVGMPTETRAEAPGLDRRHRVGDMVRLRPARG